MRKRPGWPAGSAWAAEGEATILNRVTLAGNLGRDPELIHTRAGEPSRISRWPPTRRGRTKWGSAGTRGISSLRGVGKRVDRGPRS